MPSSSDSWHRSMRRCPDPVHRTRTYLHRCEIQRIEELQQVHEQHLKEELATRDVNLHTSLEELLVSAQVARSCMCFPHVKSWQHATGGASAKNFGHVGGGLLPFCHGLPLNLMDSSLVSNVLIHSTSASWLRLCSKSKRCNRRVLRYSLVREGDSSSSSTTGVTC